MTCEQPCEAFVLSGGGSYAAYAVGILKALVAGECPASGHAPVDPGVIAGVSAGAFNAALLLSHHPHSLADAVQLMERVWLDRIADSRESCGNGVFRVRGNPLLLLDPACVGQGATLPLAWLAEDLGVISGDLAERTSNLFTGSGSLTQRAVELPDVSTFLSAEPLRRLVADVMRPAVIRASARQLRIAATNWKTGALRVFQNTHLTDDLAGRIIVGSASIPGVFPSVDVAGEPFVDAALVMNTPLSPAIEAGADVLHTIYMDPEVQRLALPRLRNTVSSMYRSLIISFAATMNRDITTASRINESLRRGVDLGRSYRPITIHRYYPREDLGGAFRWLTFAYDHLAALIERGIADARTHDCEANRCILAS